MAQGGVRLDFLDIHSLACVIAVRMSKKSSLTPSYVFFFHERYNQQDHSGQYLSQYFA